MGGSTRTADPLKTSRLFSLPCAGRRTLGVNSRRWPGFRRRALSAGSALAALLPVPRAETRCAPSLGYGYHKFRGKRGRTRRFSSTPSTLWRSTVMTCVACRCRGARPTSLSYWRGGQTASSSRRSAHVGFTPGSGHSSGRTCNRSLRAIMGYRMQKEEGSGRHQDKKSHRGSCNGSPIEAGYGSHGIDMFKIAKTPFPAHVAIVRNRRMITARITIVRLPSTELPYELTST